MVRHAVKAFASCLIATSFVSAAKAGSNPSKIAIAANSAGSALILQTPPVALDYYLSIQSFEPVVGSDSRMGKGGFGFRVNKKSSLGGFIALAVKPGRYVIHMVTRQTYWANCFNGNTFQFSIASGQVMTLGKFDAERALSDLTQNIMLSGRTVARGVELIHFLDNVPPPSFEQSDETIEAARQFARSSMPLTTVRVEAANLVPATFVARAEMSGSRVCGTGKVNWPDFWQDPTPHFIGTGRPITIT
jgi:hypothetical protein